MTYKDNELLLKDLTARLPYGVKVCIKLPDHQKKTFVEQIGELNAITRYGEYLVSSKGIDYRSFNLDIKPYLRPMSSMTPDEMFKYDELSYFHTRGLTFNVNEIDWLNENMFDYRGLIPKGIALKAPADMYI